MDVYFSFAHEFSEDASEIIKKCSMEYERIVIIAVDNSICKQFVSHFDSKYNNVTFYFISGPTVLGPIKNLLNILIGDADFYFIDLENINNNAKKIKQLDPRFFNETSKLSDKQINYHLEDLDPNLGFFIKKAISEFNSFQEEVGRFLIGESHLSDSLIMAKINSSDFDNVRLSELNEFLNHLRNICGHYESLNYHIDATIKIIETYMLCVPEKSEQLAPSSNSIYVQDSYPCAYKINSVINYLAYTISMNRRLYNKAFMHLFRTYEYYSSGVLLSREKAKFGNANKKGVLMSDCYLVNGKQCMGFYKVYQMLATATPNIVNNKYYIQTDDFISIRNKFHYTHGDLRIRKDIVVKFESVVINQITFLEQELMQKRITFQHLESELKKCLLIDEYQSMMLVIRERFLKGIKAMVHCV